MFNLSAEITVDQGYFAHSVRKAVYLALIEKFSLVKMDVGQVVKMSSVIGLMHTIQGVVSVKLNHLYDSEKNAGLFDINPEGNEIYQINPNAVILKVKVS